MYTSQSVMCRVPYDRCICHKALTHRFSAKDSISVMFTWTFVLLNKEHHGFGTKNEKSETDFK